MKVQKKQIEKIKKLTKYELELQLKKIQILKIRNLHTKNVNTIALDAK